MYAVLLMHACRRKGDHSDPDWLLQLELSRRVSAAHRAAEQCLMKANVALRTQQEVLKALTHMVHVLPTASQVCAELTHVCSSSGTILWVREGSTIGLGGVMEHYRMAPGSHVPVCPCIIHASDVLPVDHRVMDNKAMKHVQTAVNE